MTRRTSDADFSPTTWTTNALPPVELSTDQREKYRQLATQLLSNTLRDYDIYSADSRQRRMSRRRWKPVKTRDHITVYKERYPTPSSLASTNHQTGVPSRTSRASIADRVSMAFRGGNEWTEPKLLVATGWIEGALDDVMYGVSSPDAQSMLMKATVVKNTLVNGAVLACIDAPCDADPFRFLGIKWFVKGPPTGLQGIVRPRDLVFIEATGVTTRPNGERIGYQLLHSVDLPQYRDLTPQSRMEVTRGRISSCSIFREIPAGLGSRHSKVDVYVKGYVEAHGKLLDSVALTAASTGLMSSWNSVECANLKKLMWCFRQQPDWGRGRRRGKHRSSQRSHASSSLSCSSMSQIGANTSSMSIPNSSRPPPGQEPQDSSSRCGTCIKRLTKLSGAISCALCYQNTCSRCRVSRTLKEVNKELWLRQEDVLICKRCVLRVDNVAAVDVARAEVAAGWFSVESVPTSSYGCSKSFASTGVTTDTDLPIDSFRGVEPAKEPYPDIPEPSEELQVEKKKKEKVMLSDRERREQIWSQMVELRMLAESIYQLTLETTESLNATPQRTTHGA
ncbi:hypothetical protein PC129_g17350 [Phytophthora cactorum]|uniref:FYVE-type domain-containing protein n=2 Tax=Phytophthora cactorum TaxID=29920 RepID=A0A8T1KPY1_9STRA|nr:hypothetical protein Pcac1_g18827 [Phytophthora cactorum]KAG2810133.1 hypothetical protein PC112_g16194 [Phytophthora cactorum]KAG2827280.1 hypothetical protein PC111_g8633 [Phytophthora cactorum]KAG2845515.1 hypothetical protein PC113_g18168 [Phytophthora cactorum]KAG2890649.1 hypothetical protein PC114_g17350 [Phytophthora cactorum]